MKLEGKSAIVTGGGRGIGREIALALASEGVDVLVSGRQLSVLEETVTMIEELGRRAIAVVTDVSEEAQVSHMVHVALEVFGKVDILINNAGTSGPTSPVTGVENEHGDEVMAMNLTGAFLCAKAVIPQMLEKGSGKIVNISSLAAKMDYALRSPDAASKWGMRDFSATLAQELGPHNIQVNAICPGPTNEDRVNGVISARASKLGRTELEVEEMYVQGTGLKKIVDPQHIAAAVVFFCSPEGDSINGEALEISDGYAL